MLGFHLTSPLFHTDVENIDVEEEEAMEVDNLKKGFNFI